MKEDEKQLKRARIINLSFFTILLIGFLFWIMWRCDREFPSPSPTENTDLQNHNNLIKRRNILRSHRTDQAKQIIPKTQSKAQVYFDTVIVYMPDTCKPYLSNYKALRDSTENLLLYLVASQDSTIKDQDTIIQNQAKMLENDKVAIRDTVRHYEKAIRRRGFKRFCQGALLGAAVVEGVNVIKNLKP